MPTSDGSTPPGARDGELPQQIPSSVANLERELKFSLPSSRVSVIRSLLYSLCQPDRTYPPGRIVTVYFDDAELECLEEKINSDYRKTKIRARWYQHMNGRIEGAVFVECKRRVGSRRTKLRVRSALPAAEVAEWPLERLNWSSVLDGLRAAGVGVACELQPVLRLSYLRERFTDVFGGGRLSLDTDIRVEAVNPRRLRPGLLGPTAVAVLEYKGQAAELPAHLHLLVRAGARKVSYSKYFGASQHVRQEVF
jgi:hypothetical protein